MKILRLTFILALVLLVIGSGALLLLKSRWGKNQIVHVFQEIALQSGVKLSIGQIEGELPLKWSFSNVELQFSDHESVQIDRFQARLALVPLLRGHFGLSYLQADQATVTYNPESRREKTSETPSKVQGSFFLHLATIDQLTLVNSQTKEAASYKLTGSGKWIKGGKSFFAKANLYSPDLNASAQVKGSCKKNWAEASLHLKAASSKAFAPFYTLPVNCSFEVSVEGSGPLKGGPIHVNARLYSPFLDLQAAANIGPDFLPKQLEAKLKIPDFSVFSSSIQGSALGEVILKDNAGSLALSIPTLSVKDEVFTQGTLSIEAVEDQSVWSGKIAMQASHPTLGMESTGQFSLAPGHSIQIKGFDLQSLIGRISGDLTYDTTLLGGLSFQITNLSALSHLASLELAGRMGGTAQIEKDRWSFHAKGKQLKIGHLLSEKVDIDLQGVDFSTRFGIGALKITSGPAYFREASFNAFTCDLDWDAPLWNYRLEGTGDWKGPFALRSQGKAEAHPTSLQLSCHTLEGQMIGKKISLEKPFEVDMSNKKLKIDQLRLMLGSGSFHLSTLLSEKEASIQLNADSFPLDFLTFFSSSFSLKGLASLDVDLKAESPHLLDGKVNVLLQRADIYPTGSPVPIQTKGTLQLHLAKSTLQLQTHLVATGQQLCDVTLSLPFNFTLSPFHFAVAQGRPLAGQCTIEGSAEQLFDFINIGSQRVGGFISTKLLLSGTGSAPMLYGPVFIQGGFYENHFIGIAVRDADVIAEAVGSELIIKEAHVTDGEKGKGDSAGTLYLTKNLPFSLHGTVSHFRVLRFDWLTGACSGPYTIDGNLEKALAKASLELDEADVSIPEQLPSDLPTLPVTWKNQPKTQLEKLTYSEPYPFYYEIDVHGDHDLRLSGRGLEAELGGDVQMTGKNLAVAATGALYTKKGKFSFAGKDFNITKGELLFSESSAFMNITSSVELQKITVTIHFRGSISNPQLIFESSPPLPTSSIISHILFDKDVSELSGAQAIQLANTIVSLSGTTAPNVLETIRKSLGVDRLTFTASEEGVVSVQIGKYLTHGVTITLIQSTESSQVKVEVELSGGFLLEAETQEDNQGKFSFKWNKNY